jgi:hypothetical protein
VNAKASHILISLGTKFQTKKEELKKKQKES